MRNEQYVEIHYTHQSYVGNMFFVVTNLFRKYQLVRFNIRIFKVRIKFLKATRKEECKIVLKGLYSCNMKHTSNNWLLDWYAYGFIFGKKATTLTANSINNKWNNILFIKAYVWKKRSSDITIDNYWSLNTALLIKINNKEFKVIDKKKFGKKSELRT